MWEDFAEYTHILITSKNGVQRFFYLSSKTKKRSRIRKSLPLEKAPLQSSTAEGFDSSLDRRR